MDINATLDRIRELSVLILSDRLMPASRASFADELASECQALDGWMRKGGFPPASWHRGLDVA